MRISVTGHQDIPTAALGYVIEGIENVLDHVKENLVGISSLAVGADQHFASHILDRGGRLEVVLPCKGYEKIFHSLQDLENFHSLLDRAATVETLNFEKPSAEAYLAAGYRVVDLSELLLAIWDGRPAKGTGGTADIVEYARSHGKRFELVWPTGIVRD